MQVNWLENICFTTGEGNAPRRVTYGIGGNHAILMQMAIQLNLPQHQLPVLIQAKKIAKIHALIYFVKFRYESLNIF